MPDVVGALGPSCSLRRFDGERLGGVCRWHLDPARFGNRGGEALGWQRGQRAGAGLGCHHRVGRDRAGFEPGRCNRHEHRERGPQAGPRAQAEGAVDGRRRQVAVLHSGRSLGFENRPGGRENRGFIGVAARVGQGIAAAIHRPQVAAAWGVIADRILASAPPARVALPAPWPRESGRTATACESTRRRRGQSAEVLWQAR